MKKRVSTFIMNRRIKFIYLLFIIGILMIIIRLAFLQFFLTDGISEKAEQLWLREISFIADRGKILDTAGNVLTDNVSTPSIILVPAQITDKQFVIEQLANILQVKPDRIASFVNKRAASVRVHPEGRKISDEQEKQITELNLPGVYLAKDSKRHYPYKDYLAHVLGFTGIDNQGLMGLEKYYDSKLQGDNGSFAYYSDAKGQKLTDLAYVYNPPKDGRHLKTTIDVKVQTIVERELDLAMFKYNPDSVMAIVANPNTGGILAMASRPNFQPEYYNQVDPTIFDRNLPIWSTFEPGSTFKIITLAAALEEDVMNFETDRFFDKGAITVAGARLRCWKKGGHGSQSILEVVENSCNPGFVHIGQQLGDKKLFSYIRNFGFGEKTGIDLAGEGSGILFREEQIGPVELATTSFGQGVSVTPIQQVMAVAAIVNGGNLYEPQIAKEWIDPATNKTVEKIEPKIKRRVISEATSKKMRETLESVVANGTGRPAYVEGYRVGGKTGTAQKVGKDGRYLANNHIVSFIGFAPADQPEIVVYVAVDNPKNTVQFGGVVSAPIVGKIIEDTLTNHKIVPRTDGLTKKYIWPEQEKEEIPDLIGAQKTDILNSLVNFELDINGKGTTVINQQPEAGTMMPPGSTIRIYLAD